MREQLDRKTVMELLYLVQKPAAYAGGERNSIVRREARARMAVSYPDLYEVGMANNGIRILYDRANAVPGIACERVFAVSRDFEEILRRADVPLYSLETFTPLAALDLLAFNAAHELLYTNILQILDLGRIPLRSSDRSGNDPIVIAGGSAMSNPFPFLPFLDAVFIGDGEEGIADIARLLVEASEKKLTRGERLGLLGTLEGVLLPGNYTAEEDGGSVTVKGPVVRRRVYRGGGIDPLRPILPSVRITQDRAVVEVARGCYNLCQFCHAGYYELPYREQKIESVVNAVRSIIDGTGYDEITLSSLSISDYRGLSELLNRLLPYLTEKGVSVSLPSMKVDVSTIPIIEAVSGMKKTGLTFAVESASELIRSRAGKKVWTGELLEIVDYVFSHGWNHCKFYFMLGLPGSREVDEAGEIIGLIKTIKNRAGRGKEINVTLSPFVPKPHTPFEGEEMRDEVYFRESIDRIRNAVHRSVLIRHHNVASSVLEGVLSRGDSRLADVIEEVYRSGARFDSWKEHFKAHIWFGALERRIPGWRTWLAGRLSQDMPWHLVDTGFSRLRERRTGQCLDLSPGTFRRPRHEGEINPDAIDEARRALEKRFHVASAIRLVLTRKGPSRFLSHLDFAQVVRRALRTASVPLALTQGFNKHERISYGFPTQVGIESEAELCDVLLYQDGMIDRDAVNGALPEGMELVAAFPVGLKSSPMAETRVLSYSVVFFASDYFERVIRGIEGDVPVIKETKKGPLAVLPSAAIHHWVQGENRIDFFLYVGTGESLRADSMVTAFAAGGEPWYRWCSIVKTGQWGIEKGGLWSLEHEKS